MDRRPDLVRDTIKYFEIRDGELYFPTNKYISIETWNDDIDLNKKKKKWKFM